MHIKKQLVRVTDSFKQSFVRIVTDVLAERIVKTTSRLSEQKITGRREQCATAIKKHTIW